MAQCCYHKLSGLILGGLLPCLTVAQTLYIGENQQLYISDNTLVVLSDDMHNRGTLTNHGTLQVAGNWTNEQTYLSGPDSEVILAGGELQQVDQRGQAFHHLTISGGGSKELLSEARVAGALTLSEGVVVSRLSAPLTLEATATVVGGSEASYVEETMLYRGNGLRTFPLGLSGDYLPITLTDVAGQSPGLRVRIVAPHLPALPSENLERVSTARYWQITTVEGTFEGSMAKLTANTADAFDDLVGAVVVQSDQVGASFTNLGQSARDGDASQGSVISALPVTQPIVALGVTSEFSLEHQALVPSAFAPEAPNPVNRVLKVYAATLLAEPFSFRIFDRWGNLVYRTNSLAQARDEGWDGLRQPDRSPAAPGVYQYHLRGVFENNSPINQTGTIMLFR